MEIREPQRLQYFLNRYNLLVLFKNLPPIAFFRLDFNALAGFLPLAAHKNFQNAAWGHAAYRNYVQAPIFQVCKGMTRLRPFRP